MFFLEERQRMINISKFSKCALPLAMVLATPVIAQDMKSFTMGYSAGYLSDPFQAIEVNATIKAAQAAGLKTLPVANANGDAGRQIADIRNLISAGAEGVIVMPTDSNAIAPAVDEAASQNIPVVAIDNGITGGKVSMVVRANNVRMGEDACKAIGESLGGKGKVLSLLGDLGTSAGRERTKGFNDCMSANYADIQVNEQPTNWKTEKAVAAAQTVVSSEPDLKAIYLQSDSVMLAGVLNVLQNAGRLHKTGEEGHIFIVSIDGTPAALQSLRDNQIDVVISQPVDLYVKYGLQYLQEAKAGKSFVKGPTDHNSEIVDYEGSPMDLLPARVVTAADASDTALWGNAKQ
jgi:ABC-type sugar transport system substrate-binding protein